jgi:hypothetical protein
MLTKGESTMRNLILSTAMGSSRGTTVMKSKQLGLAGALLISALSSSAWANLVVNGNFSGGNEAICHGADSGSSTACPGWNFVLAPINSDLDFNDPVDNKVPVPIPTGQGWVTFGAFGPAGEEDKLYQVLSTTAGDTYQVSFLLEYSNDADQNFKAMFGSDTLFSESGAGSNQVLTPYTFDVKATGPSTTLAFFGYNYPSTNLLADVSVVPTTTTPTPPPTHHHHHHSLVGLDPPGNFAVAAPEPSTWAMMLLGLAGLGYTGFRRSRKARLA